MKLHPLEPREQRELAPSPDGERGRRRASWGLRLAVIAALVGAAAWALYANLRTGRPAMDMSARVTAAGAPYPVVVAPVGRGLITGTVTYTGSVAPFNEEDIFPRVTGRIVEMPVYPGDRVRPGQVVARLDDVELTSRLREAEAMAATAQASRAQMEADLVAAEQGVAQMEKELAMVEAELEYAAAVEARSKRLLDVGAISQQEYENDRSLAASLRAKREAARARIEQARAMERAARRKVEAAAAMVAQATAAARTARVVRDYVTIVAPTGGYVVKRLVAPGVLVQPGMPILKIAQIDRVRLQANVGERDLALIRVGSPVTVTPVGAGQAPIAARVTSVFPFVDQGPRTAVVEALVENSGRRLLPGQYATMQFVTGSRPDALTVPLGAVVRLGGRARVWIAKDGRADPKEVTTGLENPDWIEITGGLAGGERVIVRGHEGLYAGAPVADVASPPAAAGGDTQRGMPGMTEREAPAEPAGQEPSPPAGAPPARKETPHAGH